MDLTKAMAAVETILFAMGDSVEIDTLADALGITREEAENAVIALEERCGAPDSGLMLNRFEELTKRVPKMRLGESTATTVAKFLKEMREVKEQMARLEKALEKTK